VLENLNVFLKHRESHLPYSLSVCSEDLARYFAGPAESRYMEYEYAVNDPELFRHVMPAPHLRLRVQSVSQDAGLFRMVLKAFGAATGTPVLVNTSFNGFHEPIVCSPTIAPRRGEPPPLRRFEEARVVVRRHRLQHRGFFDVSVFVDHDFQHAAQVD